MQALFRPEIQATDLYYEAVRDNPRCAMYKGFLESLWSRYEPYADRNFEWEIARQFHQRFWEMYLACVLMDQGYHLIPRGSQSGPDLCVEHDDAHIWIEAVAPGPGTGPDAVPDPFENADRSVFLVPDNQIILRYTSAIEKKRNKRDRYLDKGLVSAEDPFVIAVNGRGIPMVFLDDTNREVPQIVKAVLPIGSWQLKADVEIAKISGSPVSTDAFLREKYSGISAIIFSDSDIANHPPQMGTEFRLLRNPGASNPLPRGWLPIGLEFWVDQGRLYKQEYSGQSKSQPPTNLALVLLKSFL